MCDCKPESNYPCDLCFNRRWHEQRSKRNQKLRLADFGIVLAGCLLLLAGCWVVSGI